MDVAYKNITEKFGYGNAGKPSVYFDEENRRHLNTIRQAHAFLGMSLVENGKLDSARKELRKYDSQVLESNCPYGMTSNRGNFHNRVTMTFLYAAYRSGDLELAKKVAQSSKSDLEQQMKYYRSLGDGEATNESLYMNAAGYLNQKGGVLGDKQEVFAQDIVSSYQMLMQMADWEKQYGGKTGNGKSATENAPTTLSAPDSPKTVDTVNK